MFIIINVPKKVNDPILDSNGSTHFGFERKQVPSVSFGPFVRERTGRLDPENGGRGHLCICGGQPEKKLKNQQNYKISFPIFVDIF